MAEKVFLEIAIDRLQRNIFATDDSGVAERLFDKLHDLLLENNMSENYFMSEEGRDLMMYLDELR